MNHTSSTFTLRSWLIAASLAFIAVAGWILVAPHVSLAKEVKVGTHVLQVEVVSSAAAQELGLGGRPSMDADHGMLFVFPNRGVYPFWMKGMHFPLDIIWIDGDTVTEITTLQPPASPDEQPQEYMPKLPADRVLEINAGMAKKLGIGAGTGLTLPE